MPVGNVALQKIVAVARLMKVCGKPAVQIFQATRVEQSEVDALVKQMKALQAGGSPKSLFAFERRVLKAMDEQIEEIVADKLTF